MSYEGQSTLGSQEISDLFEKFIERMYTIDPWILLYHFILLCVMNRVHCWSWIEQANGPDDIPPLILNNCASVLNFAPLSALP
jgi:hypothetical protein